MEIRGWSIRAVELIVQEAKKSCEEVNEHLVDYFLWEFRREKCVEMEKFPYHKTRSIFY